MKMQKTHYKTLQDCMLAIRKNAPRIDQALITMELDPHYSDERIRWNWLYATMIEGQPATTWLCENLYPYLDDSHIDTALRRITGLTK